MWLVRWQVRGGRQELCRMEGTTGIGVYVGKEGTAGVVFIYGGDVVYMRRVVLNILQFKRYIFGDYFITSPNF